MVPPQPGLVGEFVARQVGSFFEKALTARRLKRLEVVEGQGGMGKRRDTCRAAVTAVSSRLGLSEDEYVFQRYEFRCGDFV